nr:MAG TPA: hypothetical protein [Inoviridae sp.]
MLGIETYYKTVLCSLIIPIIAEEHHFPVGLNSLHLPMVHAPVICLISFRLRAPLSRASRICALVTPEQ